ncbi:predicted protein [Plenodomus lingam JN3]|uniref:Predicted protein n=1 Tax=Leptosphaeria maculans (strain JN3 / isolate v23.1.3 / race Av1-4-5-6-7-8) TaxID=985895 RepID=E4ZRE7_LEPMJ|nr:predicted protein [Plenodomus lingam JN3]CBX94141.1 predicted protein [Plenodomus lingam JN3]
MDAYRIASILERSLALSFNYDKTSWWQTSGAAAIVEKTKRKQCDGDARAEINLQTRRNRSKFQVYKGRSESTCLADQTGNGKSQVISFHFETSSWQSTSIFPVDMSIATI